MSTSFQKILSVCLKMAFIGAILGSTAYLLMLGWYSTLLLDDYGFVADVDKGGAYELMKNAYLYWQCRFSAFYVLGWILKIWGHASNLIGYTILLLVLGYGTIYYALRNISKVNDKWLLMGSSILITNVAIMAYLELSTFYWVCCALYTLSTYAAIVLITAIYFSIGRQWIRWCAVIFTSLYLCGGAENFTPIIIAGLGMMWIGTMIYSGDWHFWRDSKQLMTSVSILILICGFVAVVAGPGTYARAVEGQMNGFMEHFAWMPFISKFIKATAVFSLRLLSRGLYYLLLFPIGLLIGSVIRSNRPNLDKIICRIFWSFVVFAIVISISIAAPVFGMGWYSPLRSYSFVSFLLAAWIIYLGVIVGWRYNFSYTARILAMIVCLIILTMSIHFYAVEQPAVAEVNRQIRISELKVLSQKQSGNDAPIILDQVDYPLWPNTYSRLRTYMNIVLGGGTCAIAPPSTYFPYERYVLTTDPNAWQNRGMQRWAQVKFEIVGCDELIYE